MNVRLDDVHIFTKDGEQMHLDQVFLRGSQIRFFVIPDMLSKAPMFKKVSNATKAAKHALIARGKTRGRGALNATTRGKQIVASIQR